ncbi:MAG: AEC family transporter [Bacillota bacterium]|nr:AEC family transporter [Bacillota bacterium]
MNSFLVSVNAVFPFLFYLFFGYCLRALRIADEDILNRVNKIIFVAFFPFTMFNNVRNMEMDIQACTSLVFISLLTLTVLLVGINLVVPLFVKENAKRGVIIQALYRSNILLYALPLAECLFGKEGLSIASIVVALCVPVYNVVAIVVLEYYRGSRPTLFVLIKKVIQNPLLQGTILGLIFSLFDISLPNSLDPCVKSISSITTPLALMVLGGTTKISSIQKNKKYIIPTLVFKMIIFPAIALCAGLLFGLRNVELFSFFLLFATPVAVASYSMACNMGGEGALAGELVSISTIVSIFTLFLWIWIMTYTQLIYPI